MAKSVFRKILATDIKFWFNKQLPEFDKYSRYFYTRRSFWLLAVSSVASYLFVGYATKILVVLKGVGHLDKSFLLIIVVFAILGFGVLVFLFKPGTQLKIQEVHNQPSWVFNLYWGVINGSILCVAYSFFVLGERNYMIMETWLFLALLVVFAKWLNELLKTKIDLTFKDFAAGSVGLEGDKLNFKLSADNVTKGLVGLGKYINIVGIYGGLGFGKSSYTRMILENFNPTETLYTYISLTETNEAKDFSKLFAERWLGTLAQRYPKFDVTSHLPFMDSILRESGNSFLSGLLKFVSIFNFGLIKTKTAIYDTSYAKEQPLFVSDAVGKIFGNIPEISEKLWIVVVDEIERGQFDEIYRLVEIIERFKNEGRSGLPVKLLFVFCISEPELGTYLKAFENIDPRVRLLQTFFYEDPKSIVHRIFLPPVEPQVKYNFIWDALAKFAEEGDVKHPNKVEIEPNTIGDPSRSFMGEHKESMSYTVGMLAEFSIRVISRTIISLEFFYSAFRDRTGGLQKNAIRFSDIIALEFIKIKYPYLIEFFTKTIHVITEVDGISAYLLREDFKEKKIGVIEWIEKVTGKKFSDVEKEDVTKLVGLVMYYYFDFLMRDYNTKTKDKYFGTTSYPEIMHDYLSLVSDSIETGYRKYSLFYQKHKNGTDPSFISGLDNKELTGYARFLYDIDDAPQLLNLDLIHELGARLLDGRVTLHPLSVGDTAFDEAIYQFVFQVTVALEKDRSKENTEDSLGVIFAVLKKVLTSPVVSVGSKFIILNSLTNNERGGGSYVHHRLEGAFVKILKYYDKDFRDVIKKVFEDAKGRYLDGNEVLYTQEENFFFVLYQGWSGSKDATDEISRIREAAMRDLEKYPEAIKLYWNRFPIKEGWRDFDDLLQDSHFFFSNDTNTLYMPLETLVSVTKLAKIEDKEIIAKLAFWEGQMLHPKVKNMLELKDDPATLKAVLTRRGFL